MPSRSRGRARAEPRPVIARRWALARVAGRTGEGRRPHPPAFIRRQIPPYELLGEEGLALIESQADRLLAEVGIEIRDDAESLQLFRDAGATVDGVTVHFDPGHVKALCATAPASSPSTPATRRSRSRSAATTWCSRRPTARRSCATWPVDAGTRHSPTSRTSSSSPTASPWLHHSGGTICEPVDVPVNKRHLDMVYAHMRYNDKAFMGSVTQPQRGRRLGRDGA